MSIRLWLLTPNPDRHDRGILRQDPCTTWDDKTFALVVRAESQGHARKIADTNVHPAGHPFLDPTLYVCTHLRTRGKAGVILTDEHWA